MLINTGSSRNKIRHVIFLLLLVMYLPDKMLYFRFNRKKKKQEIHPERITKYDKNLDYTNVTVPVTQKGYRKIEIMNNINISVFGYKKTRTISKEKFIDMLNLLLITKGKEQHYVLIEDFNKFMYNQIKHKERKISVCIVCSVSVMKKALINHKEIYITINGAQAMKLPKTDDRVDFKN